MNVIDILKKLGYDVLESNHEQKIYTVRCSKEKKKRLLMQIKAGKIAVEKEFLNSAYVIVVTEVSFNDNGNLYVEFRDAESYTLFDAYEYQNMSEDELF